MIDRRGRRAGAERAPASAAERVMVGLSSRSPNAPALLRKAARLADRLDAPWYAVYIQTPAEDLTKIDAATQRAIGKNLELAQQLGGITLTFRGRDVASTVALVELAVFSLAALVVATAVLNRAVSLRSGAARSKRMAESTIVARAATTFSLFATVTVLYAAFFAFVLLAALTFFPHQLRSTWTTVKPATRLTDEVQIAMFLAAMGVLSGSLGGAAERKALIRHVLFVDEET